MITRFFILSSIFASSLIKQHPKDILISKRSSIFMKTALYKDLNRVLLFAMAVLLSSCYLGSDPSIMGYSLKDEGYNEYRLYPGPILEESQVVKINLSDAYYALIDGLSVKRPDYQCVLLLPGEHEIYWGKFFTISVLIEPTMYKKGEGSAKVNLKAGHIYNLHADRTYGHGYQMFFWIEDAESGEVIAGIKKP